MTYLGNNVSSSVLPFVSWAYHLCLNFWLFCRLCLTGLVLGEIKGRPLFMLHPMGLTLLMMRPLLLASRQLRFYRAILTMGLEVYLLRLGLGGGA